MLRLRQFQANRFQMRADGCNKRSLDAVNDTVFHAAKVIPPLVIRIRFTPAAVHAVNFDLEVPNLLVVSCAHEGMLMVDAAGITWTVPRISGRC
ncbi:MAG: hypothetical protein JO352_33190 [Chloroflexi bacterium]|nr:hypothetical protein [Chloroflexota bacterium]